MFCLNPNFSTSTLIRSACILILAFGFSSCGDSSNPAVERQGMQVAAWTLKVSSNCNKTPSEQCIAAYGFSVDANGKYTVGPGPHGEILIGIIPKEQFGPVTELGKEVLGGYGENSPEQCLAIAAPEGVNPVVSSRAEVKIGVGEFRSIAKSTASTFCHNGVSNDLGQRLLKMLDGLASKYYPIPFPDDECDSARAVLDSLYAEVRKCDSSSDCSYIDDSFLPVPRDMVKLLSTGDCSGVSPLVAGNKKSVVSKLLALMEAKNTATVACKKRMLSGNCSGFSEFKATQPAAICENGACRPYSVPLFQ